MRVFTDFVCIDWSGAAMARPKGIALAHAGAGDGAPTLLRPSGGWSRAAILEWLGAHAAAGSDMIVGIDFSPSLPFLDHGGFFPGWAESPADARALWALVDRLCAEDAHLGASGVVDHLDASRHFRRHGGREGDMFGGGAGRLRAVEIACRAAGLGAAQSCFNLVGAAQVGKSSLTGMRVLHRLAGRVPVWPFDPAPARGPLIVEIYTTIAARAAGVRGGSKLRSWEALDTALRALGSRPTGRCGAVDDHSSDAILTAAWLRRAAADRTLWASPPPAIADTEGWTFGVPYRKDTSEPA
jgi:hypothetical protein